MYFLCLLINFPRIFLLNITKQFFKTFPPRSFIIFSSYIDIFVSKERNSVVQPNGDVSISFEIAISECHKSTLEFMYIDLTSMESRSKTRVIDDSSLINFTQWISGTQYMCVISLVLPSMHKMEVDSFNCSTSKFLYYSYI